MIKKNTFCGICRLGVQVETTLSFTGYEERSLATQEAKGGNKATFESVLIALRERLQPEQVMYGQFSIRYDRNRPPTSQSSMWRFGRTFFTHARGTTPTSVRADVSTSTKIKKIWFGRSFSLALLLVALNYEDLFFANVLCALTSYKLRNRVRPLSMI